MSLFCNACKKEISEKEYNFSKQRFGRALCRVHQKKLGPEEGKAQTNEEKLLGDLLEKKYNWRVSRNKWDGYKHIDIAIPEAKVNLEIDGAQHSFDKIQALSDLKRTYYSFKKGWVTIRIPNELARNFPEETAKFIDKFLRESSEQIEDEDWS